MSDSRLGRIHVPDSRDANYPASVLIAEASERTSRHWADNGWWGDQKQTSECVGYAWAHWIEDGPITHGGTPPIVNPDWLYAQAQKVDGLPGAHAGTTVRAAAKVLQQNNWISAYHWAQSIDDVVQGLLQLYPVVVGFNWYDAMFTPDPSTFVIKPQGRLVGGHAFVLNGINTKTGLIRMKNSWGRDWGHGGHAYLELDSVARLLSEAGECCLAVEVKR